MSEALVSSIFCNKNRKCMSKLEFQTPCISTRRAPKLYRTEWAFHWWISIRPRRKDKLWYFMAASSRPNCHDCREELDSVEILPMESRRSLKYNACNNSDFLTTALPNYKKNKKIKNNSWRKKKIWERVPGFADGGAASEVEDVQEGEDDTQDIVVQPLHSCSTAHAASLPHRRRTGRRAGSHVFPSLRR